MLKALITRVVTLYAANGKFHSLCHALWMSIVGFLISWNGGFPKTKIAVVVLLTALGGALWGSVTAWLRNNVALASVQGAPATPAQAVTVGIARDRLAEAAAASTKLPEPK